MALDTTPGGATSNSYADTDELDTYLASRFPSTTLAAAADGVKENVMIAACRLLDASFKWTGGAVDSTQVLAWPRTGMVGRTGYAVPTDAIPQALKDAQCEFAVALYQGDRISDNPALKIIGSETTVQSIKAGSLALSFGGGTFSSLEAFDAYVRSLSPDFNYLSKIVPDAVRLLLVQSWYSTPSLKRALLFSPTGAF